MLDHGESHSSLGATAVALLQTLSSYGIDTEELASRAGLELAVLANPESRIPAPALQELVRSALAETGDPCLGLRFADYVHPTTFHALGLALLSSATLRAFCGRLERYYAVITTNEKLAFVQGEAGGRLEYRLLVAGEPDVERVMIEGSISTIVRFIRFMYRPDWVPARVTFRHANPEHPAIYERYLGPNVTFGADADALEIGGADLEFPLPAANAELARQNDEVVVAFLKRAREGDVPTQVHAKIIELLPSGTCSKEKVARALAMSVRALHNRLADAGTSYQQLLDQTRQDLAEEYMRKQTLNVSEIAYLLGFSDGSNFSRAFRRWTGSAPTAFRENVEHKLRAVPTSRS